MRRLFPFFFFCVLIFCFSPDVFAQATYTAASASLADFESCVNSGPANTCSPIASHTAVNGDVILVPCSSAIWTVATIPANVGFTVQGGAGCATPNSSSGTTGAASGCATGTVITDNADPSNSLFAFSTTYGNPLVHLSCIDIEPESSSTTLAHPIDIAGTCTSSGCPQFRVDNITFGNVTPWTEFGNGSDSAELVHLNNAFGVLDHNTLPNGGDEALFAPHLSSYLGTGLSGDNSWAEPDSIGGANNVFAENNLWNTGHLAMNDCEAPGPEGCRYVIRYNTVTASQVGNFGISQNHGTETGGRSRSGREAEVYNNTISCVGACTGVDGGLRGGTGMFFGNHAILFADEGAGNYLGINDYRTVASFPPWGGCWGNGGYDQNDGVVYYTGTITSGGTTLTLSDSTKTWTTNQFIPAGEPYSFYDTTVGFGSEIASNTSNSVTVLGPISEEMWSFANGDGYQIIRATTCIDQMGRGQGTYISGTVPTPTGWVNEILDPIYEFADYATGPANVNDGTIVSGTGKVINNRDFYAETLGQTAQTNATSPFNGTSGTGWGTLANRPTTCTPAVGYFATNVGSQGTLYVCLTPNTWSVYYTPYVYPNPLIGNPPVAPTGLIATVQ